MRRKKNDLAKSLRKSLEEVKNAQQNEGKLLSWREFEEDMKKGN